MDRHPHKRKKNLTSDDLALWKKVTDSISPLKSAQHTLQIMSNELAAHPPAETETETSPENAKSGSKAKKPSTKAPHPQTPPVKPYAPTLSRPSAPNDHPFALEMKTKRRIAKGHVPIEATIDLHGMIQRDAHAALRAFITRCCARGYRHVLVITGKGSRHRREEDKQWWEQADEPGVLRRQVPVWLRQSDLRAYVLGIDHAHQTHGGDGAFYVRLKKLK